MNNKGKTVLWVIALVLLVIMIGLGVAGTVFMFYDKAEYEYRTYYDYSINKFVYDTRTEAAPETGIMPLVGTVLLVVGLILLIFAHKKSALAIGSAISVFITQILFSVSWVLVQGSVAAVVGFFLCLGASSLGFSSLTLLILYVVLAKTGSTARNRAETPLKNDFYAAAAVLKEIKGLYDTGIFTKEEYETEKQSIFEKYGLGGDLRSTLNGTYVCMNSKITISDNAFSMTYDDRVLKVGTVEEINGSEIILVDEEGKKLILKKVGSALETIKGTRYEKK